MSEPRGGSGEASCHTLKLEKKMNKINEKKSKTNQAEMVMAASMNFTGRKKNIRGML